MYKANTISYNQPDGNEAFLRSYLQGQWKAVWNKLTGNRPNLEEFNNYAFRLEGGRKHLGPMNVAVSSVTGSVGRSREFDRDFRPLKTTLRDHWVNAFAQAGNNEKLPITVYKIGDKFFVKEGHNSVSVLKFLGKCHIKADVWEFSIRQMFVEKRPSAVKPVNQKLTAAT